MIQLFNSLLFQFIFIALVCLVIGYHAGNRFYFNRIEIRNTKEIKNRIEYLRKRIRENNSSIHESHNSWRRGNVDIKIEADKKIKILFEEIENYKLQIKALEWTLKSDK